MIPRKFKLLKHISKEVRSDSYFHKKISLNQPSNRTVQKNLETKKWLDNLPKEKRKEKKMTRYNTTQ